jgi:hypothetical protein
LLYLYGLIFVLFALTFLLPVAAGGFRRWQCWLMLIVGAGVYLGLVQLQTPLQEKVMTLLSQAPGPWLSYLAVSLLAALLQEGGKLIALWAGQWFTPRRQMVWVGAFLGGGFVLAESYWILHGLAQDVASFYPDLTFVQFLSSFSPFLFERLILTVVGISLGTLLAYGLLRRQPGRYFLLVMLLHAVLVFASLYRQSARLDLTWTLIVLGVFALILYLIVLSISRRSPPENDSLVPFR